MYVVKFKAPYTFEGKEYTEVDLSGLEKLSAADLIEADKQFNSSGQIAMMNEVSLGYCLIVASKASGKPIEFFQKLPAPDAIKVKNTVINFLNQ